MPPNILAGDRLHLAPQDSNAWHQTVATAVEVAHQAPKAEQSSTIIVHRPVPVRGTRFIVTLPETPTFKLPNTKLPPPFVVCSPGKVELETEEELAVLEQWSCRPKPVHIDHRGPPPPPDMALWLPAEDGEWWETDSSLGADDSLPAEWFEEESEEVAPPATIVCGKQMAPPAHSELLPPPSAFAYPPLITVPTVKGIGRGVLGLWRAVHQ